MKWHILFEKDVTDHDRLFTLAPSREYPFESYEVPDTFMLAISSLVIDVEPCDLFRQQPTAFEFTLVRRQCAAKQPGLRMDIQIIHLTLFSSPAQITQLAVWAHEAVGLNHVHCVIKDVLACSFADRKSVV